MKVIILAAGQGTRLKPLTNNTPKCMVELLGKPLIQHQLDLLSANKIEEIYVVGGYMVEKIRFDKIKKIFHNEKYSTTNMVYSLMKASSIMNGDDLLIIYGDIVYNQQVLNSIILDDSPIGVVVDENWREYWEARMIDPINDVETLRIENGAIIELGKRPHTLDEIQGQYIGMIKIREDCIEKILNFYNTLNKLDIYDGKNFENMYMTSFLQKITTNLIPIKPIIIHNGWMEIDEPEDLNHIRFLK